MSCLVGLGVSPSGTFFTIFRNYMNSRSLSQLMDLQGANLPNPCLPSLIILDILTSSLVPLKDFLSNVLLRFEDASLMDLRLFMLGHSPIQWADIRLALWGTPPSRQTTLMSLESVQLLSRDEAQTILKTDLNLSQHRSNCDQALPSTSFLDPKTCPNLYNYFITSLGHLDLSDNASPTLENQLSPDPLTLSNQSTNSLHALNHFGIILTFLMSHLAVLCGKSLETSDPTSALNLPLVQFVTVLTSIVASLSKIRASPASSNLLPCFVKLSLLRCLGAIVAVLKPPSHVKSEIGTLSFSSSISLFPDIAKLWTLIMKGLSSIHKSASIIILSHLTKSSCSICVGH